MSYLGNVAKAVFGPMRRMRSSYNAASYRRRMSKFASVSDSINSLLRSHGDTLRNRSRHLARNSAYAGNALDSFVSNAVGTGVKPQTPLHEEWDKWTKVADADGVTDFYGLQALAVRESLEAGECFVRIRHRRPGDGLRVPLQLQLIEPEHVPLEENRTLPNGNVIRSGIEFDKIGRRVAYHMHRQHPGENTWFKHKHGLARIPAEEIIHLYKPVRAGQIRGEPWFTRVLTDLWELEQYQDAELVRKKTAALFAAFITELNPEDPVVPTGDTSPAPTNAAPDGVEYASLEPGTIQKLLPGESVEFAKPADVGNNYEQHMIAILHKIAAGLGITYHQLTGDLRQVNYSSIRAGLVEFRRRMEQFQWMILIHQFCRPVYAEWVRKAAVSGRVDGRASIDNLIDDVEWRTPRFEWVDPDKDIKAEKAMVRAGFKSRGAVINEMGYDEEVVDAEIKRDKDRAKKLGLIFDTDPEHELNDKEESTSSSSGPSKTKKKEAQAA